jgi:hypothetical protein
MRSLCLSLLTGVAALGVLAVNPSDAQAWWHRRTAVVVPVAPAVAPVAYYYPAPVATVTYYSAPVPVAVPTVTYYSAPVVAPPVYVPAPTYYVAPTPVAVIRVR